jgi:hypothetical protein
MKKYLVEVHYQASVYRDVEAESEEEAEDIAKRTMYTNCPYDELFAEVVFVEENNND